MFLVLIVVLIFVNALFVMAEMAFVSSRRGRLQALAEKGDLRARSALDLIEHPARYLSTIQLVITITGIVLGMFGEASIAEDLQKELAKVPAIAEYSHSIALGITVIVLSFISILFAELIPKRLGQMFPEAIARLLAVPMDLASRAVAPVVGTLSGATELLVRVIPIAPRQDDQAADDEVKAIMASGAQEGVFHQAEQEIVERALTLGDRRIRSLMVPRSDIDFLDVNDSLQRVRVAVATSSHSQFPICEGGLDHLLGAVHVKDLIKHGLISDEIDLRSLCKPPVYVPESSTTLKVLEKFKKVGTHMAFVIDEYGVLVGLITLNDIIENLLGEITLTPAADDQMVIVRADGSYLLDGMVTVEELKDIMGLDELPKQDVSGFDTLGGFVMTYLGRVPSTGDRFTFGRYGFEIMDMDRTRVDRVLLTIQPEAAAKIENVDPGAGE